MTLYNNTLRVRKSQDYMVSQNQEFPQIKLMQDNKFGVILKVRF